MKKLALLAIMACIALPQLAYGGAWTLPQKNIWVEHSTKFNWATEGFNNDRNQQDLTRNAHPWGWSMSPKAEYGVTDWFTVLGGMEYKQAWYKEYDRGNWGPYSVKHHGITEAQAGFRLRLLEKPVVVSTQFKTYFYTGYQDLPLSDVAEAPELGDRTNMYEIRLMASKKFDTSMPFYLSAESGFRWKERNAAHDIPVFVEGGFWPLSWFLVKGEIDGFILAPNSGRETKKEYLIWRVGPNFDLLEMYDILFGDQDSASGSASNSVTRQGKALNVEIQYGNWFWGRNVNKDQEFIIKISGQY